MTTNGENHTNNQQQQHHHQRARHQDAPPKNLYHLSDRYSFYLRLIVCLACSLYLADVRSEANLIGRQAVAVEQQATLEQNHNSTVRKFKFTLISGKFWRFNLRSSTKANTSQQTEPRLYKITQSNNLSIVDEDFWFQYDSQQQQFIAWPSLQTIPGTYQFALLPPGLDMESTCDEFEIEQNLVVVARIIVELLRPLHQFLEVMDGDLDHLIDHKFSLGFLHRRSNYPLLVQQIVDVFEAISSRDKTKHARSQSEAIQRRLIQDQYKTILLHSKGASSPHSKLGEYILISSSYTSDGEYFSITWSYHKSLINNTISQLRECSMTVINSTISRLSNSPPTALVIVTTPSRGLAPLSHNQQQASDDLYVHYKLDAPISRFQPIIPTERGGYALKLTLGRPCQSERVLNELGLGHLTEKVKK